MSAGQLAGAYINQAKSAIKPVRRVKRKEMKLSLKQRFRNWLMDTTPDDEPSNLYVEADRFQSDGIRLQVYKASGGYVVETRGYDRKTDRNHSSMHVINEDADLGDSLGKIVMMEALKA